MVILLLSAALASEPTPAFTACMSAANNNHAMIACATEEHARQDVRLNTVYKALIARFDATGAALLKKAELAWITFRDAECASAADVMRDGSAAPLITASCMADMTRERADTLDGRLKVETGL